MKLHKCTIVAFLVGCLLAVTEGNGNLHGTKIRLIGGTEANENSAPFIASLLLRSRTGYTHFCAGSIVNEYWILTAAHCLVLDAYRIYVAAGHYNVKNLEPSAQIRRADFVMQHEYFDRIGPFDIGLLHVSRPFEFSDTVQPVILSEDREPAGVASLYGWGSITATRERKFPSLLQTVDLTLVTNDYCESAFPVDVVETNICAGLPDGGKGGCVGDSGGPLMQNGTQIGIVSWGPADCDPENGPTVFTKVADYIGWINKNLKQVEVMPPDSKEDKDVQENVNIVTEANVVEENNQEKTESETADKITEDKEEETEKTTTETSENGTGNGITEDKEQGNENQQTITETSENGTGDKITEDKEQGNENQQTTTEISENETGDKITEDKEQGNENQQITTETSENGTGNGITEDKEQGNENQPTTTEIPDINSSASSSEEEEDDSDDDD